MVVIPNPKRPNGAGLADVSLMIIAFVSIMANFLQALLSRLLRAYENNFLFIFLTMLICFIIIYHGQNDGF
jgi:hypothetical protein